MIDLKFNNLLNAKPQRTINVSIETLNEINAHITKLNALFDQISVETISNKKPSLNVIPTKSVGNINFGMKKYAVRKTLGDQFTEFKKSKFANTTADNYKYMHVFYNNNEVCVAIEIIDAIIHVKGQLVPQEQENFNTWIKTLDDSVKIGKSSTISNKLSIGASFSEGKVQSILFGNNGYYE